MMLCSKFCQTRKKRLYEKLLKYCFNRQWLVPFMTFQKWCCNQNDEITRVTNMAAWPLLCLSLCSLKVGLASTALVWCSSSLPFINITSFSLESLARRKRLFQPPNVRIGKVMIKAEEKLLQLGVSWDAFVDPFLAGRMSWVADNKTTIIKGVVH